MMSSIRLSRRRWLAALLLLLALATPLGRASAADPVRVVASLTDLGAIAREVGGDQVSVTVIASGIQDPHFVDPRPSYVVKLRDAELFLVNGLDLEIGWVPPLIAGARNAAISVGGPGYVDCSRNVPRLEVPSQTLTRAEGDVHPLGNPHYATDPLNQKIMAETVASALSRARPESAAYFQTRKKSFQHRIDQAMFGSELVELVGGNKLDRLARSGELDAFLRSQSSGGATLRSRLGGWLGKLAPFSGRRVAAYHRSYSYFVQRFGLEVVDYVERRPGIQPGPSHLAELIGAMRRDRVTALITHPFYDQKIGRLVADKGHARLVVLPLNQGGVPGTEDAFAYFDLVTSRLSEALGGPLAAESP